MVVVLTGSEGVDSAGPGADSEGIGVSSGGLRTVSRCDSRSA
jgi:hypothetical protein